MKHNGIKNPNWPEANHWPFSRVVEDLTNLGLEEIQLVVRVGLEPGASELQVQHSYRLATLPPHKH